MEVQNLLEKGLYHYGLGEVDKAIEIWREVLRLDPANEVAREYIEIETGRKVEDAALPEEPESDVVEPDEEYEPLPSIKPLSQNFMKGQSHLHSGSWDKAVKAFSEAHREDPSNPIYQAHAELSRARLIREVRERIGGGDAMPRLTVSMNQLASSKKFTQEQGFVISLLTGDTTLDDIIALSPLPRYQSYHIIHELLEENLAI